MSEYERAETLVRRLPLNILLLRESHVGRVSQYTPRGFTNLY